MSIEKSRTSCESISFHKNNKISNQIKDTAITKTTNLKKLKTLLSLNDKKILEIKGKLKSSTFHLVGENDKYKQIQKNLQNTILNISIKMIKDYKFDPDLTEISSKYSKKKLLNGKETKRKSIYFNKSPKHKSRQSIKNSRHSQRMTQIKQIANEINRKIKRIHNLYDSFGEDESDKDKEQGNYGLNPRSIIIDIYDIFLFFSAGFCLLYMPYRLAKTNLIINDNEYFIMVLIAFSEVIYIIDLILGFFRWFYNNEFKLVSNIYIITKNYLTGNFILDLIMAIPFYSILKSKNTEKFAYNVGYSEKYFWLKILMCFKAFKIFKISKIKNNRVTYFLNKKFTKNYYLERLYQIINFTIIMLSLFNLIICYHIYIAELSYPNWIVSFDLQDKSFFDIYFASFYFIIATMTSVGYGDIVCKNSEERYFQIILLSIGLVAYSWIISAVGDYVKNKSRAMDNFNRDMTKLEEIRIAYPNMPFKLYNKIQQHIQRMLTQNKKYEYNILVNSLPYYLQNSVLFQIHKNQIERFTFFRDCDNSDFILKVLTHFIPIFSKKNIVLVGEGEFYENIFFIKDGKLSLEAIIDLDNIEMSIEKYLKYRFEEIEQIEVFSDSEDSKQKSTIKETINNFSRQYGKKGKIRTKKLIGMISKQFENLDYISSLNDSGIDQEIGKCDFHTELKDLYKGNIEYIHILDLLKNEYFGEILMFLNIPNPLSLKVKTKRVELYILRKKDAFNIRKDYQNIWQRINKKSIHNIKSLKSLTLGVINRYCEMNGIIVKDNTIIKSNNRSSTKYYSNKTNNIMTKRKSKLIYKFNLSKNKRASLTSLRPTVKSINLNEDIKKKKTEKKKNINVKNSLKMNRKLELNLTEENDKENSKNKKDKKRGFKSANSDKGRKGKTKKESSGTLTSSLWSNKSLNQTKENKKITKEKTERDKNNLSYNSFSCITQESTISLEIISSYENINAISKGNYIDNDNFQSLIKSVINNCINTNSLEIENNKDYLDKFNFIQKNIQFNKLNSDFNRLSDKNNIYENNLKASILNSNSISKKIVDKKSKLTLEKYVSFSNNIKNQLKNNNQDEIMENNSLNNNAINQSNLNSNKLNKNLDILSELNNNINSSNMQLKEDKLKRGSAQTFGKMKEIEDDSKKNLDTKNNKAVENIYSNNIIKNENGNNIHEVNLNYVNNFCCIY